MQLSVLTLLPPQELKAVLLGSGLKCFPLEWRSQAFTFSEMHDLRYGIVQKKVAAPTRRPCDLVFSKRHPVCVLTFKGGPCGVLASVQALVLKMLLFECPHGVDSGLQ